MIPRCAVWLPLATSQVQAVRFTDLRYFVPMRSMTGFCIRTGWHSQPGGLRSKNCHYTKQAAVRVNLAFDNRRMPALGPGNGKTEAV